MRHGIAVVCVLLGGLPAVAQTAPVKHWPRRDIDFPVPPEVLKSDPKPVKLRLYSATGGGAFQLYAERSADNLDRTRDDRPPGFNYTAKADGEEEFAVQLVYADGTTNAAKENLRTEFRIVFDTKPPAVQIQPNGAYGVEWVAADENLSTLKLERRWTGTNEWFELKQAAEFRARDGFSWPSLARESRSMDVRLVAKDKAGNEFASRTVRLPSAASDRAISDTVGDRNPERAFDRGDRGNDLRSRLPAGDDFARPEIMYVNTNTLSIKPKLTHVTRSGVKEVKLFVKTMNAGGVGEWKLDRTQSCAIKYGDANPAVEIPFQASADGRYGFIVVPVSGAGLCEENPRASAPPQHLVEVDTKRPVLKITNVLVSPGANGPRAEIQWDAADDNMMPDPVVLEYAEDRTARDWKSIAEKIPNSRRYVWEVSDKAIYKFYVRARVVDKAANSAEHVYDKEVNVDLERPSAVIELVRPSGAAVPFTADRAPAVLPPVNGK